MITYPTETSNKSKSSEYNQDNQFSGHQLQQEIMQLTKEKRALKVAIIWIQEKTRINLKKEATLKDCYEYYKCYSISENLLPVSKMRFSSVLKMIYKPNIDKEQIRIRRTPGICFKGIEIID